MPIFDTIGLFREYRGIDRDITGSKTWEEEITRRNRELESLASILDRTNRSLDVESLVPTVPPEISRVLKVHSVFLFLMDRQGNLISKGSFGVVEEWETADELTGLCCPFCETAMQHEESVF